MQALLASEVSLPVHVHGARIIAKSKYVIHHGMCTAGHIDIQYVCIIHSCMYYIMKNHAIRTTKSAHFTRLCYGNT